MRKIVNEEENNQNPGPSKKQLDGVRRRNKTTTTERPEGMMDFDEFFSLSQQNKRNSGDDFKKLEYEILLEKKRRFQLENECLEVQLEKKKIGNKMKMIKYQLMLADFKQICNNNNINSDSE